MARNRIWGSTTINITSNHSDVMFTTCGLSFVIQKDGPRVADGNPGRCSISVVLHKAGNFRCSVSKNRKLTLKVQGCWLCQLQAPSELLTLHSIRDGRIRQRPNAKFGQSKRHRNLIVVIQPSFADPQLHELLVSRYGLEYSDSSPRVVPSHRGAWR